MGITKKITCDNCGAEKLEKNHWFMAHILPVIGQNNSGMIAVYHLGDANIKLAEQRPVYDLLCGEACVLHYVSRNLPRIVPKAPSLGEHPASSKTQPASNNTASAKEDSLDDDIPF